MRWINGIIKPLLLFREYNYKMKLPENKLPLRNLPSDELPRERILRDGASMLSSSELIAIVLGTGTSEENVIRLSERVLSLCGGLDGLMDLSPAKLEKIPGIGPAKLTRLLAVAEISRRMMVGTKTSRPVVRTAQDAANLVLDMRTLSQEQIRVILVDYTHRVISIPTVYIGTINTAVVRVAEILREAIARNAPALVLVHNHPSGDPTPSPEDVALTKQLVSAGNILDIVVLDHIIIGDNEWKSLKEMRLGFN